MLLRTFLEKSALSSPVACLESVRNRIRKVEKDENLSKDPLEALADRLEDIGHGGFSKYQLLLDRIASWNWDSSDPENRIVIFSERVATIRYLEKHLQHDLKLGKGAIRVLMGAQSDVDQQGIVEAFGNASDPVRILLSTDVGAEGINLHYHCRRLIHFDIPWSIMVLQQRNGRIDRYGQKRVPEIYYLMTESEHESFKADQRILKLLIDKEEQAHENIGDPASLMGVYDKVEEEKIVTKMIEARMITSDAEKELISNKPELDAREFDPLAELFKPDTKPTNTRDRVGKLPSLFPNEYQYLKSAIRYLGSRRKMWKCEVNYRDDRRQIQITAPESMKGMTLSLPVEARPKNGVFNLTEDPQLMMKAIKDSIAEDGEWPVRQYLWPLHPIVDWATDKLRTSFKRMEAPVVVSPEMEPDQFVYVLSLSYPNLKGTTIFEQWVAVTVSDGDYESTFIFEKSDAFRYLGRERLTNSSCSEGVIQKAQEYIPDVVEGAINHVRHRRNKFEKDLKPKLQRHEDDLEALEKRRIKFLEDKFASDFDLAQWQKSQQITAAKEEFDNYRSWMKNTMNIGQDPYVEVIAVLAAQ